MNSNKPIVRDARLILPDEPLLPPINLGSAWWFKWLDEPEVKTFTYEGSAGNFNARKEERATSSKQYWSAYKRYSGKLRKVYIGTSDQLTFERLEEVAKDINQDDVAYWYSRKNYVAAKEKRDRSKSYPTNQTISCVTATTEEATVTQESWVTSKAELEALQAELEEARLQLAALPDLEKVIALLQEALPLKANAGGAIKKKIEQALVLLKVTNN